MLDHEALYTTGSVELDRILGGGLPGGSTTILAGLPGTGKTILAEQFLFANATSSAPALYLTTLSEPLVKVVRYVQKFAFFDPEKLPGAINSRDIGEVVHERGVEALPMVLEDWLLSGDYAFVAIDSFKAFHDLSTDTRGMRVALFDLTRIVSSVGTTALLLGEYSSSELAALPEFAVADGVIELINRSHGVRDELTLRVHKLRGAAPLPGEHSFRIDREGLHVFPRLVAAEMEQAESPDERVLTGVPGLDPRLHGGLWRGSATMVAGPTGIGKTRLCLRYLLAGAQSDEPGLLVAFQESPPRIRRMIAQFGLDAAELERAGQLRTLYVSPLELDLVELFGQIRTVVERDGARRLVIDALSDLRDAALDQERFRAMIWILIQYMNLGGLSGLLTLEARHEGARW